MCRPSGLWSEPVRKLAEAGFTPDSVLISAAMDMTSSLFAVFGLPLLSLVLTAALIPLARRLAIKGGYVDEPGGRKQHAEPVPPIGGIVIFCVFMAISMFVDPQVGDPRAFYAALMLILVTGIVDDARPVPSIVKFCIHFAVGYLVVVPGGVQIETLGNLLGFGELRLGWFSIPFSIACVVYIINAVNMMDGLDGLAGGKSLIVIGWLITACILHGFWEAVIGIGILAGALSAFLIYNMRHPFRDRANVFLGDAGSMALGLSIAWFSIGLSQGPGAVMAPVSVAWIIALPIIDAFGLLVMRIREGRNPFDPDRRHFHHHFLIAGYSVGQSTFLILSWSMVLGAIGFVGYVAGIPEPVLGWGWVALWLGHAVLVTKPQPFIGALSKLRGSDQTLAGAPKKETQL